MLTTLWTIRLCLLFYALALGGRLLSRRPSTGTFVRICWTAAALLCLFHVLAAFHHVHDWSHGRAVDATARDTRDIVGIDWGGGVWINYTLLVVWAVDVSWMWAAPANYRKRSHLITWTVNGFVLFIVANGAIVFADGPVRQVSVCAALLLLVLLLVRRSGKR